VINMTLLWQQI